MVEGQEWLVRLEDSLGVRRQPLGLDRGLPFLLSAIVQLVVFSGTAGQPCIVSTKMARLAF